MALKVATSASGQLAYIPETEAGTIPTKGKGVQLRMTGESLEQTISKEVSKEINASRQTAGMYLTDSQVSGGFNIELSATEYDPLIEAVLMDTWSAFGKDGKSQNTLSVSITPNRDGSVVSLSGSDIANFKNLTAGCWFSLSGNELKPENKRPLQVKSIDVSGKRITVTATDLVAQNSISGCYIYHSRLTNGTTMRSFALEKTISDLQQYFQYTGCRFSKMSLAFESKSAITGSFDVIGMNSAITQTPQLGDKTAYTPSQTNPIMDAVLGMDGVFLDGKDVRLSMTAGIQKIALEYDNNMTGHDAVGVLGNVDVTAGTISCTANLTMYFQNGDIYNDVIKQRRFNLAWYVYDSNGRGYAFTLPSVEIKNIKANMSDNSSAVMAELECQALMDATTGKTIFIDRF